MKHETIIALLVVLIMASAGAGYYVGNSSVHTTTSVSKLVETSGESNLARLTT